MTTNTSTTEIRNVPLSHGSTTEVPIAPPPTAPQKPGKRGFVWVLLLLIVAGVAAFAVWRASQPGLVAPNPNAGGRRAGGRGRGGLGPTQVRAPKAMRTAVPAYLTGLGNVSAFYTVTVKS